MPARTEMLGDGTIGREEPLGVTGRLKALHAPLPLARRPMRVLAPVIEITTLAMLYPW